MVKLHFKTELCDGECHMTAHEYAEHKYREKQEKQRAALAKIANNPILKQEIKDVIRRAILDNVDKNHWRKAYIELKEQYEKEKKK